MQVQTIPLFQNAHILRRDMLETLSDYTFLMNRYLYKGYSDGILAGCELTTTEDTIVMNEGIILIEGQPYLIKEALVKEYHPTNTTIILKICFSAEHRDNNILSRRVQLELTGDETLQKGELELCRFKLQEGARLRYVYQDFEDRSTEFDTLNTIHALYAAPGGSSLAPNILKAYARELLTADFATDLDKSFCIQILGQDKAVSREALKAYLEARKQQEVEDYSNAGIYRELLKIIKEGGRGEENTKKKKGWRLTVE